MQHSIDRLPEYLKAYCVMQEPDSYTPEDHAAWRFIMRQCRHFFDKHGVNVYLDGLKKTGILTDRIPRIDEIDEALRKVGWGAVPVRGFIPPFAFLELQSRKILPIASDMRQADHILYTPAPDIVHEAAGHAPILADQTFSSYIIKYANLAKKAIFCEEDLDQYEAIRILSDVKENPDSTEKEIEEAEQALARTTAAVPFPSEAAKVARMYWWTAEYGLVGDLKNPKIYGAGLLSSISESRECLSDKVKKIPLTVDCVDQGYDITKPQPQLFVARDLAHLSEVLDELENRMSYKIGGTFGLDTAISGRTVVTAVLDSAASVSGKVTEYIESGPGISYFKLSGPAQIAYDGDELPGQGVAHHPDGFSTPLGFWENFPNQSPCSLSRIDLETAGIVKGPRKSLKFVSGFQVTGDIADLTFKDNKLILIKWKNCSMTLGDKVFYEPSWGDFDMLVGTSVTSVYGGAADREKYGKYKLGETKTSPKRSSPPSKLEQATYAAFKEARDLRKDIKAGQAAALKEKIIDFSEKCARAFSDNWLLRLESLELLAQIKSQIPEEFSVKQKQFVYDFKEFDQSMLPYIEHAMKYVDEL